MKFTAALVVSLAMPTILSAETVLRYSDHQPLEGMRTRFLNDVFFPAIEAESDGRIRIEAHWDGEIAAPYDALGVVGAGEVTDIAMAVPEYTSEELPLHQLFKGFLTGPSGDDQVTFFRDAYDTAPELTAEWQDNNVVPIFLATGFPVAFYSREPMDSLDEIAGTTWRSASFWHLDFLTNAGAEAVRIPWGQQVYDAMAAGTLDGLMVNVDSGYDLKVYEIAPNVLVSKELWLGHLYPVVMNRDAWAALPAEDQQAIQRAADTAYAQLGAQMDRAFDAEIAKLTEAGATVRVLEPSEVAAFNQATRADEVQAAWAAAQETAGVTDAPLVLEKLRTVMETQIE